MKRIYIKPATERFVCNLLSVVAASPNTQWNDNMGGSGDHEIGDPNDPNPNPDSDAKQQNLWDAWE